MRFEIWCCGSREENPRWGYPRIVGELERRWDHGLRDDGARVAPGRWSRTGRSAPGDDVARVGSRRVHVAGCTPNPNAPWVIQQARQLSWTLAERLEPMRFLIRDRDQKFTDRFDDVFRIDGIEVVRTPFRAPEANGFAERFRAHRPR